MMRSAVLLLRSIACHALIAVGSRGCCHSRIGSTSLFALRHATFGMGCFWSVSHRWKPSEELLKVNGVVDTVAGYTGNPQAKTAPNYDAVCFGREWVEGVRVTYEDDELSYEQLLDAFFETQEPKVGTRQYASIIFPHDEEQRDVAERWRTKNARRVRRDGVSGGMTSIEPLSEFYQAEGYHQRYWQKFRPRVAGMAILMAVASGLLDSFTPEAVHSTLHTACNGAVLAGCAYVLLERKLDARVVKL